MSEDWEKFKDELKESYNSGFDKGNSSSGADGLIFALGILALILLLCAYL